MLKFYSFANIFFNQTKPPEKLYSYTAGPITGVACSPVSHLMATTGDAFVRIYDYLSKKLVCQYFTPTPQSHGTCLVWPNQVVGGFIKIEVCIFFAFLCVNWQFCSFQLQFSAIKIFNRGLNIVSNMTCLRCSCAHYWTAFNDQRECCFLQFTIMRTHGKRAYTIILCKGKGAL